MKALPIRWFSYLLASEFLVVLFLQPQVFAQEVGIKPEPTVSRCRAALTCRVPPYSEEARRFRVRGFIKLEAIVTTDGRLEKARILSGLPGGLNEQTIATFKAWRCNPALKDSHPVPTRTSFEVNFRLH